MAGASRGGPPPAWRGQAASNARALHGPRSCAVCRLLQLPYPEADELGRPVWGCTSSDVAKAYRRMSILVHPDKVPGGWHPQLVERRRGAVQCGAAGRRPRAPTPQLTSRVGGPCRRGGQTGIRAPQPGVPHDAGPGQTGAWGRPEAPACPAQQGRLAARPPASSRPPAASRRQQQVQHTPSQALAAGRATHRRRLTLQEEVLKAAAVRAREERERREASASGAERIALNAQRNEKAKELRKQQVGAAPRGLAWRCVCGGRAGGATSLPVHGGVRSGRAGAGCCVPPPCTRWGGLRVAARGAAGGRRVRTSSRRSCSR